MILISEGQIEVSIQEPRELSGSLFGVIGIDFGGMPLLGLGVASFVYGVRELFKAILAASECPTLQLVQLLAEDYPDAAENLGVLPPCIELLDGRAITISSGKVTCYIAWVSDGESRIFSVPTDVLQRIINQMDLII